MGSVLRRRFLPLFVAGVLGTRLLGADAAAGDGRETDTVQLPDLQVSGGYSLRDFPASPKDDLQAADFSAHDPFLKVQFPGQAVHDGIATGRATVGVMLDATGVARDFLLIRCTQPYFGEALLAEAKRRTYSAQRLRGTAIPAAFIFTYKFQPPPGMVGISNFEAGGRRAEQVQGGADFSYEPHQEAELDGGQLVPARLAIPVLPAGHPLAGRKPVRVLVNFFVDELGRVRLPNVASELPPDLLPAAIGALQQWAFQPPRVKGEPVLVYAMRALTFRPEEKAKPAK